MNCNRAVATIGNLWKQKLNNASSISGQESVSLHCFSVSCALALLLQHFLQSVKGAAGTKRHQTCVPRSHSITEVVDSVQRKFTCASATMARSKAWCDSRIPGGHTVLAEEG